MIRGIELPMVIDTRSAHSIPLAPTHSLLPLSLKDDEQISTALGYVVHLLSLASKYLQVSSGKAHPSLTCPDPSPLRSYLQLLPLHDP
jgi:hypothetical protein